MSFLQNTDPAIYKIIKDEERRQANVIRLIPSENYVSKAVMEATGSVLTNKYSEGYAGKRYYEGQEFIDQVETLAVERAKALFGAEHANLQPYSGSPANQAVYFALTNTGDTTMGMSLPHGGHLTHGWPINFSGRNYTAVQYTVRQDTELLDYDNIFELAKEHKPKIIFAGGTAYPRIIDFKKFSEIAKAVDAHLIADIAHINGLIVAGEHPSPVPYADVVTSTSHKAIRGPRGGFILCKKDFAEAIDRAVFPGLQGGPHNNTTAAMGVAFHEASKPEFKVYGQQVVKNAKALAAALMEKGFHLVTGGTDNHLILVNTVKSFDLPGKEVSQALNRAGIVCNYNTVPFDERKPFNPSGIRLGTPAITSRGMKEDEMRLIAHWMHLIATNMGKPEVEEEIKKEVEALCNQFPAPGLEEYAG